MKICDNECLITTNLDLRKYANRVYREDFPKMLFQKKNGPLSHLLKLNNIFHYIYQITLFQLLQHRWLYKYSEENIESFRSLDNFQILFGRAYTDVVDFIIKYARPKETLPFLTLL